MLVVVAGSTDTMIATDVIHALLVRSRAVVLSTQTLVDVTTARAAFPACLAAARARHVVA